MQIPAAEGFATSCGLSHSADANAWAADLGFLQHGLTEGDPNQSLHPLDSSRIAALGWDGSAGAVLAGMQPFQESLPWERLRCKGDHARVNWRGVFILCCPSLESHSGARSRYVPFSMRHQWRRGNRGNCRKIQWNLQTCDFFFSTKHIFIMILCFQTSGLKIQGLGLGFFF